MNTSLYNNYRTEIRTLISGVLIISVFLIVKIFSIQVLQHNKYKDILTQETVLVKEEEGSRGKIYDRNNLELASNINKVDFWVNTSEEFDKNRISAIFSKTEFFAIA